MLTVQKFHLFEHIFEDKIISI